MIADDHPLFRGGLRALIDQEPDLLCVAEAATARDAVDRATLGKPDVAVLDLRLPDGTGISATRRILAETPGVGILLLTMVDDEASAIAALHAGARGYALKDSPVDDIVRAIRAVGHGEAIFGPAIADRILALFADSPSPTPRPFPDLTEREHEILDLLAYGSSNGQIARRLELAPKTVRNHVSNICNKLQVTDRAQAALRARDAGVGPSSRS